MDRVEGLDGLIGKPTSEIVRPIMERHTVSAFFAASTRYFRYEDSTLEYVSKDSAQRENWVRNVRRRMGVQALNLTSRVMLESRFGQIPMLDFDFEDLEEDERISRVRTILDEMILPDGVIANSGDGIHYLSPHLGTEAGFRHIINEAFVRAYQNGGIDRKWAEWSKANEFGQLRLTRAEGKPIVPTVKAIHRLNNEDMIRSSIYYGFSFEH